MIIQPAKTILALIISSLFAAQTSHAEDGIQSIGTLDGFNYSVTNAVNATGDIVVGYVSDSNVNNRYLAFRWTKTAGMQSLGTLNGGSYSIANAVNAAGDVIVGDANDGNTNQPRAFRWTEATGMQSLGTLNGGSYSIATGVNAVGDVVVGYATDGNANNQSRAFRWTEATDMQSLGTLNGGSYSIATAVNAVGDVVVGYADDSNTLDRAFRWTKATGMQSLGTLNGGKNSYVSAVNAAGNVVVGNANDGNANNQMRAFRWTEATGMQSLGTLNGGNYSTANAINATGDVIVGSAYDGNAIQTRAFRWTESTGMQSVEDWLTNHGVHVDASISTTTATGVSSDGNVVVGRLNNKYAFIARASPDSNTGSGLINVDSFTEGLARVTNSSALATSNAALVMNGMHSNPMRMLLSNGQSAFSVGGDAGRHDTHQYDTDLGLAEISYAHRFNDTLQVNLSAGQTYSHTDTDLGGKTTAQSTYIMPQFVLTLPANTYASVDAFYGQGHVNIHRAYLNAGTRELTTADPDTTNMGVRLRLDWLNALSFGQTSLTPYSSLTYIQTKMDGYSEQGVAFPVRWDSRTDRSTTAHLGIDAVHTLSNIWTLTGKLEAAHRFENREAFTSGQVEGLGGFGFTFSGNDVKQNWLRIGAGAEANIGKGVASLMLNATTKGSAPSYWLSANYMWKF